ncbi:hypothetical protein [Bacillus sp. FJAT-45037]|uniref:hypothetical protein n=1 Tax=Bacillus sp. FJAT-45037 TaxID=2011007 RepID=UPI000C24015E|nr:hypothetical protein [Bacillus sp. FJAT-45037]
MTISSQEKKKQIYKSTENELSKGRNPSQKKGEDYKCPLCCSEELWKDIEYCSSCDCPRQLPVPRFPSPNTSFSPKELAEIDECIEEANELLLALVDEDDFNERSLQVQLRKLRGYSVTIHVKCHLKNEEVSGCFIDAGKDFIILEKNETGNLIVIMTKRVISIHQLNRRDRFIKKQDLTKINPCLRRELTLNFSQVVTRSPFLLNVFFGLEFSMFLESNVGHYCYVKTEYGKKEFSGTIINANKESIEVCEKGMQHTIDLDSIYLVELDK